MDYESWRQPVPANISADVLWKVEAYRLAVFAADLGWPDVSTLRQDRRTSGVADQLYRALGSVSANIAEGFSRSSSRERARFYEFALGSARESRDWYYKARHVLGEDVVENRLALLTQIIRLLLAMIPDQRSRAALEKGAGGPASAM